MDYYKKLKELYNKLDLSKTSTTKIYDEEYLNLLPDNLNFTHSVWNLVKYIDLNKNFEIGLDVGAGMGIQAHLLKKLFNVEVISLDFSLNMLRKGKENLIESKFICADARNIPFKNKSFDFVLSNASAYLVGDVVYREIFRVLKNTGVYWGAEIFGGLIDLYNGKVLKLNNLPDNEDLILFKKVENFQQFKERIFEIGFEEVKILDLIKIDVPLNEYLKRDGLYFDLNIVIFKIMKEISYSVIKVKCNKCGREHELFYRDFINLEESIKDKKFWLNGLIGKICECGNKIFIKKYPWVLVDINKGKFYSNIKINEEVEIVSDPWKIEYEK